MIVVHIYLFTSTALDPHDTRSSQAVSIEQTYEILV